MKTRKAFYRALRSVAARYNWTVEKHNGIIRAVADNNGDYPICPIIAVAKARFDPNGQKAMSSFSAYDFGPRMGLSDEDVGIINTAADNSMDKLDNKQRIVRKTLLRCLGLLG